MFIGFFFNRMAVAVCSGAYLPLAAGQHWGANTCRWRCRWPRNEPQIPDMVDAALREADADHDGQVDLQDFKTFLASKTDDSLSLFDSRVSRDGSDSSGSDAN